MSTSRDPMSRYRAPAQAFEGPRQPPRGAAPSPAGGGWQVTAVGALDMSTNKTNVTFRQLAGGQEKTQPMKRRYFLGQVVDILPASE